MKLYVAYSVHGTGVFIVAKKTLQSIGDLEKLKGFTEVKSRRPKYNKEKDGLKLHWDRLKSKSGEPLRSRATILQRFKELEKDGWTVEKKAFVAFHYGTGKKH